MFSTRFGVAQSFLAPSDDEVVAETRAISTGSSRTVARRDVMLMMATMVISIWLRVLIRVSGA